MRTVKAEETEEQKAQRIRAKQENVQSIQDYLQTKTSVYQRLRSPRVSIATGRTLSGMRMG